jgi:hypothetical protein
MKTCECGCGQPTKLATRSRTSTGMVKGQPQRYIAGHQGKANKGKVPSGPAHRSWNGGRSSSAPYEFIRCSGHPRADSRGYVQEHVLLAEAALEKYLPHTAEVHHADGDPKNNSRQNLVICENHEYHMLLHRRSNAYRACGHPDWRRCPYCHQYNPLSELYLWEYKTKKASRVYHIACKAEYDRRLREKRKQQAA